MYKNLIQGKKAVFFDLDGTIVDTHLLMLESFKKAFESVGEYIDDLADYMEDGVTNEEEINLILRAKNLDKKYKTKDLLDKVHQEYENILKTTEIEPIDGFLDILYEVKVEKGLKVALLTNSVRKVTEVVLEKLGLKNSFDLIICGDEVRRKKPHPQIYRKAARKLWLRSKEVLVFEDSVTGAKAADRAKMDTVIIWNRKVSKLNYPKKVQVFAPDFTMLDGNLDKDIFDILRDDVEYFRSKQATQTITE